MDGSQHYRSVVLLDTAMAFPRIEDKTNIGNIGARILRPVVPPTPVAPPVKQRPLNNGLAADGLSPLSPIGVPPSVNPLQVPNLFFQPPNNAPVGPPPPLLAAQQLPDRFPKGFERWRHSGGHPSAADDFKPWKGSETPLWAYGQQDSTNQPPTGTTTQQIEVGKDIASRIDIPVNPLPTGEALGTQQPPMLQDIPGFNLGQREFGGRGISQGSLPIASTRPGQNAGGPGAGANKTVEQRANIKFNRFQDAASALRRKQSQGTATEQDLENLEIFESKTIDSILENERGLSVQTGGVGGFTGIGGGDPNLIVGTDAQGNPISQQQLIRQRNINAGSERVEREKGKKSKANLLEAARFSAQQGDTKTMAALVAQAAATQVRGTGAKQALTDLKGTDPNAELTPELRLQILKGKQSGALSDEITNRLVEAIAGRKDIQKSGQEHDSSEAGKTRGGKTTLQEGEHKHQTKTQKRKIKAEKAAQKKANKFTRLEDETVRQFEARQAGLDRTEARKERKAVAADKKAASKLLFKQSAIKGSTDRAKINEDILAAIRLMTDYEKAGLKELQSQFDAEGSEENQKKITDFLEAIKKRISTGVSKAEADAKAREDNLLGEEVEEWDWTQQEAAMAENWGAIGTKDDPITVPSQKWAFDNLKIGQWVTIVGKEGSFRLE